jgi:putative methionine-R-sulfoxide reductase with GAF domain
MGDSSRIDAVTTLVSAVVDDVHASPRELSAALAVIGLDDSEAARASELLHRSRADVARLRRRERELAELFSSARELAEVRDEAALLERLVGRAHEIMGSDVAYLSVLDSDTRELEVRVTVGAVSPEFQHLHVSAGRGLVSEVVESRTPRWVSRYSNYPESRHEQTIDRAVEAEGLVSILGVPMLTGDTVLGVLFVATRRESVFSPEQVSLLSALADHASVVLQTAEMLRSLRRSDDEARRALDRLTDHLAERDRANTVHQELIHAVLRGGGFGPIAATLAAALGRAVTIVDADGRVLADSRPGQRLAALALAAPVAAADARSRTSGHFETVDGDAEWAAVTAIMAGGQGLGTVLIGPGASEIGSVDQRTAERAAQVSALLELQLTAVADTERRLQSDLIVDILESWRERASDIERRAHSFEIVLSDLDTVHVLAVPGAARPSAVRQLMQLVRGRGLVGEYRGYVTAIVDSSQPAVSGQSLRARVAEQTGSSVLCVTAPAVDSPTDLGARFVLARRTARLLEAVGVLDRTVSTTDFLPYAAVFDADPRTLTAFLDSTIGAVAAYDRERGTELLATLRAFVRSNASPTKTARTLRFHTNTVLQRLDRLTAILGEDWRDDERFFRISLAVRLDELRTSVTTLDRRR